MVAAHSAAARGCQRGSGLLNNNHDFRGDAIDTRAHAAVADRSSWGSGSFGSSEGFVAVLDAT